MSENTVKIEHGSLTIKHSPSFPISDSEKSKLISSFELAKRSLESALTRLDAIASAPQGGAVPADISETLNYHFFQARFTTGQGTNAWGLDVLRICRAFRLILIGLYKPVTIADAYATILGRERRKMLSEAKRSGQLASKEEFLRRIQDATCDVRGSVPMKKAFMRTLSDAQIKSLSENELALKSFKVAIGGHRSGGREEKDWAPQVPVSEDKYNSIHINFHLMLTKKGGISERQVARTIIHEASHKFCNTLDQAYVGDFKYELLTREQAMTNADCYAYTAISLADGRTYRSDQEM